MGSAVSPTLPLFKWGCTHLSHIKLKKKKSSKVEIFPMDQMCTTLERELALSHFMPSQEDHLEKALGLLQQECDVIGPLKDQGLAGR